MFLLLDLISHGSVVCERDSAREKLNGKKLCFEPSLLRVDVISKRSGKPIAKRDRDWCNKFCCEFSTMSLVSLIKISQISANLPPFPPSNCHTEQKDIDKLYKREIKKFINFFFGKSP